MAKNIVICCDGTGEQFSRQKSNVIRIYQMLDQDAAQVAYYHPGVGTMGARNALSRVGKWWTRVMGLAFGYGLSDNVADCYQFLMRTYDPNDRVYLFGFSRGAYTVRALCGMLYLLGLLTPGNEALIPYMIRTVKRRHIDFGLAREFKDTFSRSCKPHFVGVWDTVSSVGWVYDAVHFAYTRATKNPDLNVVRHALSIDERRAFFRQNAFGDRQNTHQDIKEVWFAGVHGDVGGGYPESQSQLSQVALKWMVGEAEAAQLHIDPARRDALLGEGSRYVRPDPTTPTRHESLRGLWWLCEVWPKLVHVQRRPGVWRNALRFNLGRRRYIAPNPLVHESVVQRINAGVGYRPRNLPGTYRLMRNVPAGSIASSTAEVMC